MSESNSQSLLPWRRKPTSRVKSLSDEDILAKCDEEEIYTLYMRLLGESEDSIDSLLQRINISSPLREGDSNPSFGLFIGNDNQLCFKDFGRSHLRGNAVDFAYRAELEIMERLIHTPTSYSPTHKIKLQHDLSSFTRHKALHKIDERLGLHLNGSVIKGIPRQVIEYKKARIEPKTAKHIEVNSSKYDDWTQFAKDYWLQWGIQGDVIKAMDIQCVKQLYFDKVFVAEFTNLKDDDLAFAYPLVNENTGELCYKIYQPYSKSYKWRNNYQLQMLEGWHQLYFNFNENSNGSKEKIEKRKELLIITKATKEIAYYRQHFDVDAVAEKHEGRVIDTDVLKLLQSKYDRVIVMLDNDKQGKKTSMKYEALGLECFFYSDKNITDVHLNKGADIARQEYEFLTAPIDMTQWQNPF